MDSRNIRPIAYMIVMQNIQLCIYDIVESVNNYVIAGYGEGKGKPRKYMLYENNKGVYFNFRGIRRYLNEFSRV